MSMIDSMVLLWRSPS